MKHWTYGGSKAEQQIQCPASVNLSAGIPNRTSSFAADGTAAHAVLEEMIMDPDRNDHAACIGIKYEGVVITTEMYAETILPSFNAFRQYCEEEGITEYEPEVSAELSDEIGGTADVIARSSDTVHVIDWKTGSGIMVEPGGAQALFYGMVARQSEAAADLFEGATRLKCVIIQPNDRGLDTTRVKEYPIEEIDAFAKQHRRMVTEAKSAHPPMAVGPGCTFCPAAPICPAKTGQALSALRMDPEDLETLHNSLDLVSDLKAWLSSVEKVAFEQLNAGVAVRGWKLVMKRGVSKWINEKAVLKAVQRRLGGLKNVTVSKLLSPAQMKKLAKDRGVDIELDEYIITESSGTTMAPEDDKRPAVLAGEAISQALGLLVGK